MIAVDADYVNVCDANKYPDLGYLLLDMVTYYSDPQYSVMGNVRSESIDSHSYSRASTGKTPDEAAPEGQLSSKRIIEKYAGPGGVQESSKMRYPDTVKLATTTTDGYGDRTVTVLDEIPAAFIKRAGVTQGENREAETSDAAVYLLPTHAKVLEKKDELEGMYIIVEPFSANNWYKI